MNQKSRCTTLEPIIGEFHFFQSIQQTERIVDSFSIDFKMISIVLFFQLCITFFFCYTILLCKFYNPFIKILMQFFFRDSTDIDISLVHRDILKIIQIAEYTDFTELSDAGKESKLNISILCFEY